MINQHNIAFLLFNGVLWGILSPLIIFLLFSIKKIRDGKFTFLSVLAGLLSVVSAIYLCALTSPIVPSVWTFPWFDQAGQIWFELGFYLDSVSVTMGLFALLFVTLWQIKVLRSHDDLEKIKDRGSFFQSHALLLFSLQITAYAPSFFQLSLGLVLSSLSLVWLSCAFTGRCTSSKFNLNQIANLALICIPFLMTVKLGSFDWEISSELPIDQDQIKFWSQTLGFAWLLMIFLSSSTLFQMPHHALVMLALGAFSIIRTWSFYHYLPEVLDAIMALALILGFLGIFFAIKADSAQKTIQGLALMALAWVFSALAITHPDGAYLALFTLSAVILSLFFLADIRAINQMPRLNAYLWVTTLCVAFTLPLGLFWVISSIAEALFVDPLSKVILSVFVILQSVLSFKVIALIKNDVPTTNLSMSWYHDLVLLPLMVIYVLIGFFSSFFDIKWALYGNISQNIPYVWGIVLACALVGSLIGFQVFVRNPKR